MIPGLISGAIAGYIASKIVDGEGKGCLFNLFIGWLGGLFGDWLFGCLGAKWHILHPWMGAVFGSILLLLIFNLIAPKADRHDSSGGSYGGNSYGGNSYGSNSYGGNGSSYGETRQYTYEDGDDTPDEQ